MADAVTRAWIKQATEALQHVCYALNARYNYRGDADVGYAVVREQYGARLASAYRAARQALVALEAIAPPGESP